MHLHGLQKIQTGFIKCSQLPHCNTTVQLFIFSYLQLELPSKKELIVEFASLEKQLKQLESPIVFCHNDLLLGNIVHNEAKKSITFIDYEYAAYNHQAFDIGNHFNEFAGKK